MELKTKETMSEGAFERFARAWHVRGVFKSGAEWRGTVSLREKRWKGRKDVVQSVEK